MIAKLGRLSQAMPSLAASRSELDYELCQACALPWQEKSAQL
jgi:hypothetical protein